MKICPDCDAQYTDWVTLCTDCGAVLAGDFDDDGEFEPERVVYELGGWTLAARSLVTERIAEEGIPHEWDGDDLIVDPAHEEEADQLLQSVEDEVGEQAAPVAGEVVYDLTDWATDRRVLLGERLEEAEVAYRWEGTALVIAEADEPLTDTILDEVEFGANDGDDEDGPIEDPDDHTVDRLFLAAERLSSNARDGSGLKALASVLEQVHPRNPPFGFDRLAWRQIATSTDRLASALADGETPTDDASAIATELRLLLQPFV
jgi:hypothetical protein